MTSRAAALLLARREELNRRFAAAAHRPEPAAMLGYLARTAVPVLDAWAGDDADALAEVLFDLGLRGGPLGLVGDSAPTSFEAALVRGLPRLAGRGAPATIVAALGNGAVRIAGELDRARADAWTDAMVELGPQARSPAELLALGLVLAWRAGLAEARASALAALAGLEVGLRRALFPAGEPAAELVARFVAPGATAGGPLRLVGVTGGFVGFGGPFARPPRPAVIGDRLVSTDGEVTCELHADVFGARLVPAAWAHAEAMAATAATGGAVESGALRVAADGSVTIGGETLLVPALIGATAIAAAQGMIAVTLADSHKVFVVGRVGR